MPNNSFKPTPLHGHNVSRYVAFSFVAVQRRGLTQVLGRMKLSSLAKLIKGELAPGEYGRELEPELAAHTAALAKTGAPAPVAVTEDATLEFGHAELATLCRLYAAGTLSAQQLAYTADVIQLSEGVQIVGESVADDLAACTDLEINGPLSLAEALAMAGR